MLNNKIEEINILNKFSFKNDKISKQIVQKDVIIYSCNKIRNKIDLLFKKTK